MDKKWIPLESNPDVLNEYVQTLGLDTGKYAFHDVFGLDEELLAMIPQPVVALLLLFPITRDTEAAKDAEDQKLKSQGYTADNEVYFMKQTISNACGTIGALHAIGNVVQPSQLAQGSFLQSFFSDTANMGPAERGKFLEEPPEGAPDIDKAHEAAAQQGQTAAPPAEEAVALHFVALVHRKGRLWELDGRKSFPIDHGETTPENLLPDAIKVVRQFMEASNSINFNLIAMSQS